MSLSNPVKKSHYTEIFGKKVHYVTMGKSDGETILMVHGFRGDHNGLFRLAAPIEIANVVIPDLPGFGESEPLDREHNIDTYGAWLREFAKKILPQRFGLVAHSFGTTVAANSISQGLDPFKVVLINPISAPALKGERKALTKATQFYYWLGDKLPGKYGEKLLKNPLIIKLMGEVMAETPLKETKAYIHEQHRLHFSKFSDTRTLLEAFNASVSHTVTEYRSALTMPVLLIAGALDPISSLKSQLQLKNILPNAQIHVLHGTGHLPHYEVPFFTGGVAGSFFF